MNKQDNKIAAQINLIKIPANNEFDFSFDQNTDWIKEILVELNENATDKSPEEYLQETSFSLTGTLEKKNKPELGEFLLVDGFISTTYVTECVRTLKPMSVNLEIPFKVCFLEQALETSEMFHETDETWIENEVYQIYYYDKRMVAFKEMIHEQVFLNYNQYPVLDAESPLEGVVQDTEKP
jgi:uncharacterized metal-binding protein YceD (DUF177 family)